MISLPTNYHITHTLPTNHITHTLPTNYHVTHTLPTNHHATHTLIDWRLLLYSTILRSQADSLRSHVILHEWLAYFIVHFLTSTEVVHLQHCLQITTALQCCHTQAPTSWPGCGTTSPLHPISHQRPGVQGRVPPTLALSRHPSWSEPCCSWSQGQGTPVIEKSSMAMSWRQAPCYSITH